MCQLHQTHYPEMHLEKFHNVINISNNLCSELQAFAALAKSKMDNYPSVGSCIIYHWMRTSIFSSTLCGDKIVIGHFRTLVEKSRTDAVTVQILFCTKSRKNSFLCSTTIPMWCSTRCVHQVMRQKLLKICARKAEWSYPQTDDINCQLSTADITSNHESNDSLDKCMEHSQIGSLSCIWRNYGNISILQTENPTVK